MTDKDVQQKVDEARREANEAHRKVDEARREANEAHRKVDEARREALLAWERENSKAAKRAATVDWKKAAFNPKDVGFRMGPMMTEEEFKAHCQRTGIRPTIIKK